MPKNKPPTTNYQPLSTTNQSHYSSHKVAIVHDWFVGGGAEKVVEQLHKIFPDAPIYTSYCNDKWRDKLDGKVVTGYLQNWPFSRLRKFLPAIRQQWFKNLDLSEFDLIISSSGNGEAKFITKPPGATHISYCHTPTHFYWRHYEAYRKNPGFGLFNSLARLGLRLFVGPLRNADYKAAQDVDHFIANSTHIAKDIKEFYGREADVVHPPVDTTRFSSHTNDKQQMTNDKWKMTNDNGFITVGRLVPNKRVDLIIKACNQLKAPLTVIGYGPELKRLKRLAGRTITFISDASDEQVVSSVAGAKAFIFASFEDFGISPVEALAAGTPVIAYEAGGALDYVKEGKTGTFFHEQTVIALAAALKSFDPEKYNPNEIKKAAEEFSIEKFHKNFMDSLSKVLK